MADSSYGFLLLDKPSGISSHTAVRRAAKILGAPKAGHAGTLDPLASGLLLVGLGRASRLLEYLVGMDKSYRATIKLGVATKTLDREGEVVEEREPPPLDEAKIREALKKFTGKITQVPPVVSAIKSGGVPLYKLARKGKEVEPPPREVEIGSLKLIKWEPPFLEIEAEVSSGTYIRSLARDLGAELGTLGTIWELRRLSVGPFSVQNAASLDQLPEVGDKILLEPEKMVGSLPHKTISEEDVRDFFHGKTLKASDCEEEGAEVALFTHEGKLAGMAVREGELLRPRKVLSQSPANDSLP